MGIASDLQSLHTIRRGVGRPLVLVHGLGGSWQSWAPILDLLAANREVIAFDLPGHGQSAARADSGTFAGLADSVEAWLAEQGLAGADLVGSSLGARLVLELARRGGTGAVIALDPGGFWRGWERTGPAGPNAGPIAMGWGRSDRLYLPRQAARAMAAFPTATLHWFDGSGHFPAWDRPADTVQFILEHTGHGP